MGKVKTKPYRLREGAGKHYRKEEFYVEALDHEGKKVKQRRSRAVLVEPDEIVEMTNERYAMLADKFEPADTPRAETPAAPEVEAPAAVPVEIGTVLEGNVDTVGERIAGVNDPDMLEAMASAEFAGSNRSSVLNMINKRLAEIAEAEGG